MTPTPSRRHIPLCLECRFLWEFSLQTENFVNVCGVGHFFKITLSESRVREHLILLYPPLSILPKKKESYFNCWIIRFPVKKLKIKYESCIYFLINFELLMYWCFFLDALGTVTRLRGNGAARRSCPQFTQFSVSPWRQVSDPYFIYFLKKSINSYPKLIETT